MLLYLELFYVVIAFCASTVRNKLVITFTNVFLKFFVTFLTLFYFYLKFLQL